MQTELFQQQVNKNNLNKFIVIEITLQLKFVLTGVLPVYSTVNFSVAHKNFKKSKIRKFRIMSALAEQKKCCLEEDFQLFFLHKKQKPFLPFRSNFYGF